MSENIKRTLGYLVAGGIVITVGFFGAKLFFEPRPTEPLPPNPPPVSNSNEMVPTESLAFLAQQVKVQAPAITELKKTTIDKLPVNFAALIPNNTEVSAKIVSYANKTSGYEAAFTINDTVVNTFRTISRSGLAKGYEFIESTNRNDAGIIIFKRDKVTYKIEMYKTTDTDVYVTITSF